MLIRRIIKIFILTLMLQYAAMQSAAANQAGSMRYNDVSKRMEFHDGTGWFNFALGVPVGGCTREGEMDYDPLLGILGSYRYCNGSLWIQVLGVTTLDVCSSKAAIEVTGNKLQVCNGLFWVNIKGLPA